MIPDQTPSSYLLPDIKISAPGIDWLSDAAVSSWSIDRQLVGSTIPGNVRSANGVSVGAADVSIVNTGVGGTAIPWNASAELRVETGDQLALYVEDASGDTLPLSTWIINPVAGALSTRGVDIDLLEAQYAGRGMAQALEASGATGDDPVDPCWIVGRLAAQAGFDPVPPPVANLILAAPLHGSLDVFQLGDTPMTLVIREVEAWSILDGDVAVGPTSPSRIGGFISDVDLRPMDVMRDGGSVFITLNVTGEVFSYSQGQGWVLQIVNDPSTSTHTLTVSNALFNPTATPVTFTPGESADWPTRVQVEIQRDWNGTTYTETRARIRSSPDATWSSWVSDTTDPTTSPYWVPANDSFLLSGGTIAGTGIGSLTAGQYAALQVTTAAEEDLWEPSMAHLKPLGGSVVIPWVPADLDVWAGIRDCCSAWLGAAIVGTDGILRMLDRDDLAGVGTTGEATDIGVEWTDLPWELDPKDSVDRVAVTFAAASIHEWNGVTPGAEAWRAPDVISVPGGAEVTIPVTLDRRAMVDMATYFLIPGGGNGGSVIDVYGNPEGTGNRIPAAQYSVEARQTSATTAEIYYENRSGQTQYLVTDADLTTGGGEPSLILNADVVADYATKQVIERGLPASESQRPLEVDLTPWVQRAQDATTIADYLYHRLASSGLWKVEGVRVRLDWTHDLGKVLRLVHSATGLEAKALVTRVHYEGDPGQIAQILDLVLLPWTFWDFNAAWNALDPAATFADFNTAQGTTRTFRDMAADNNWTGA